MTPHRPENERIDNDMLQTRLRKFIDLDHELVQLADLINWDRLEAHLAGSYNHQKGRKAVSIRMLAGLEYLKFLSGLSDRDLIAAWIQNPYWQHFCGMEYFTHRAPIYHSLLSSWRKRVGVDRVSHLLDETIRAAQAAGALRKSQLQNLNVDTTVQEKNIRFPTDARLYYRSILRLGGMAKSEGIDLRQSYRFVAQDAFLNGNRLAHSRKFAPARKQTRKLKTYLGRLIRDIKRKGSDGLSDNLSGTLSVATRIQERTRKSKNKVYSLHEPDVVCIAKGKAHKKYEYGNKVSIVATSKGGWVLASEALRGNPYDGHTLQAALDGVSARLGLSKGRVFVDRGYKGHKYVGCFDVHLDKLRRGSTGRALWKLMKRRAAIEPTIGHLKQEHGMGKCRLKGVEGDAWNASMSACGLNLRKVLNHLSRVRFASFLSSFLHRIVAYPEQIHDQFGAKTKSSTHSLTQISGIAPNPI